MTNALTVRKHVRSRPAFQAGQLALSASVAHLVEIGKLNPLPYLLRHLSCDWGDISAGDRLANNCSIRNGARLFSSYNVSSNLRLWIITEADRSATTLLLPEDLLTTTRFAGQGRRTAFRMSTQLQHWRLQ